MRSLMPAAIAVLTVSLSALPQTMRLYVFDCGQLNYNNVTAYQLKNEEVAHTDMAMGCFLIAHPKGTLMWDVGAIPDGSWKPTGKPVRLHFTLPDKTERDVTITKALKPQLAAAGYTPGQIKYLALSHYHWDHIANANDFAGATWLARKVEHDIMFSSPQPERTIRPNYNKLGKSKTFSNPHRDTPRAIKCCSWICKRRERSCSAEISTTTRKSAR
jgi:glyoxylase-like metal-dependent hydrolase (beta-lactamase superfamily II)